MNNGIEKVRAKMRVNRIVRHRGSCRDDATGYYNIPCELQTVELGAVVGGSPENNNYATATPAAKVEISIQSQDVVRFFDLDREYYVDFAPAKTFEEEKVSSTVDHLMTGRILGS